MKDEEMAEEYRKNFERTFMKVDLSDIEDAFLAGLKAGRPQWHKVADGDLPKIENRIVLCICIGGYINNEPNYVYKLLTSREFCLFQPVVAWKEIVPPSEPMRSLDKEEQKNYTESISKVYKPTGVKLFGKENKQ